jgi:peptide/nickel transport system substrate-binding protein
MNLENPSSFVTAMTAAQKPEAKFSIGWGPELLAYSVDFNYSLDVGIQDKNRDTAVRTLFRDLRFRQALAYATDRDGVAQTMMKGPFLRGFAGGIYPGSPEFDQSAVVYYPYDPASAKELLSEVGLKLGSDGIQQWTSGPMAGQDVVLQLIAGQDDHDSQTVADALVTQWAAVGIKVNEKVLDSTTHDNLYSTGNFDMHIDRGGQAFGLPFTNPTALAPITNNFQWHHQGNTPRQTMDFEPSLVDLVNKYRSTFDTAGRNTLMSQYNHIFTQNVYQLGVVIGRYGLGLAKRVKNIPDGAPAFMYQWIEPSILLDTLWTPKDQQLTETRPNTIAIYPKS